MKCFAFFAPMVLLATTLIPAHADSSSLELSPAVFKSSDAGARLHASVQRLLAARKSPKAMADFVVGSESMQLRLAQWRLLQLAELTEPSLKEQQAKAQAEVDQLKVEFDAKQAAYAKAKTPENKQAVQAIGLRLQAAVARAKEPVSFASLVSSAPKAAQLEDLSADLTWLQSLLYSGEKFPVVRAIYLFLEMAEQDASILKSGRKRDIATAVAIEFARNNWSLGRALARAAYYHKYWAQGRLNRQLDTLPMSQLRVLMGIKAEHKAGYVENYQWCLDNVHVPAEHYVGTGEFYAVCWRGTYRPNNIYGDSIHVNFYETYGDAFDTYGQEICDMGGICGALSHFGAYAAAGNGIAAQTMGEPGHCSYAVLVDGKWCPAYSLSWQRWLHWSPWDGAGFFSALQFSYDLYDAKNIAKTMKAMSLESAAMVMQDKAPAEAMALYQAALAAQPLNMTTYRAYFDMLSKNVHLEPKVAALRSLCQSMPKVAPEMAAFLLQSKGLSLLDGAPAGARITVATDFWKAIESMGPAPWDVAAFISKQADWVAKGEDKPEAAVLNFYSKMLMAVITKPDFTPAVMTWGNDWGAKQSASVQRALAQRTVAAITAASGKGASVDTLLRGALISAENMGDLSAFYALMKNVPEKNRYVGGMPTWEPFAGDLVSKGGMIRLSSTCEHDTPMMHAGVLDARGGKFHTGKDENAWVMVQLPYVCQVNGVVIVPTGNSAFRQQNMVVQVSANGEDGSWVDVKDLGPKNPERVTRVDMSAAPQRALYVRILRKGGPEFFHLNGIYVYGKRVS
ncbi:MAG: discoidin domain-containing protein [Akkermansia sp.]